MANIKPFKGIRPSKDKVHLIVSQSVDRYSKAEINAKMLTNPFSFLHVIKPESSNGTKPRSGSREQLVLIKEQYANFKKKNYLIADSEPTYYLYQQEKWGKIYTGIIAAISIDDYFNGVIKLHEQTLTEKENKLKEYLEICDFNAEPVCFSYEADKEWDLQIEKFKKNPFENFFTTTDDVTHTLWCINKKEDIEIIQTKFNSLNSVYIADGHHRSASSALLGNYHRSLKPNYNGLEGFNYYMGIFFSETHLEIFDYNRVIKISDELSDEEIIKKISKKFEVKKIGHHEYVPLRQHNFSMYLSNNFYSLNVLPQFFNPENPVESLDSSILSEQLLNPVFGIKDLKTDKRVGFVPGIKKGEELKKLVDSGKYRIAFGLFPVSMKQLKNIADTGNIMPPKTTWIEPKFRSALVIYDLSEEGY
jgi:uncharacterized protein (DUF1015 family)